MEWGGMTFDGTIHLGDVLVGLIGLVLIPLGRLLVTTLMGLQGAVSKLSYIVVGPDGEHTTGLVADVTALKKESQRHRNWLIEIRAEQGLKLDDRS